MHELFVICNNGGLCCKGYLTGLCLSPPILTHHFKIPRLLSLTSSFFILFSLLFLGRFFFFCFVQFLHLLLPITLHQKHICVVTWCLYLYIETYNCYSLYNTILCRFKFQLPYMYYVLNTSLVY